MASFRSMHSEERRRGESARIRTKYPELVPIICERGGDSTSVPDIDKKKFLVPQDLTVGQFAYVIRKRMKLDANKSMFLFVDGVLPNGSKLMSHVYDEHKDPDGFLYIKYAGENTFGA